MGKDVDACCHTCELFGHQQPPPEDSPAPELAVTEPKQLKILITERGGAPRAFVPTAAEVTVGRVQGNDIVLPRGSISKRQARFVFQDGKVILVDLKSACGTVVNGRTITSPTVICEGATIHMGDFMLRVVTE